MRSRRSNGTLCRDDDPFVEHAFLLALEQSGSVGRGTGCAAHARDRARRGRPLCALPLYVKQHSYGEYIFDFRLGARAERAGIAYYPNWSRWCRHRRPPAAASCTAMARSEQVTRALAGGLAKRAALPHLVHARPLRDRSRARRPDSGAGMLPRVSMQFHWQNDGYASFEQYLERFVQRSQAGPQGAPRGCSHGVEVRVLEGPELSARDRKALRRSTSTPATSAAPARTSPRLLRALGRPSPARPARGRGARL